MNFCGGVIGGGYSLHGIAHIPAYTNLQQRYQVNRPVVDFSSQNARHVIAVENLRALDTGLYTKRGRCADICDCDIFLCK